MWVNIIFRCFTVLLSVAKGQPRRHAVAHPGVRHHLDAVVCVLSESGQYGCQRTRFTHLFEKKQKKT